MEILYLSLAMIRICELTVLSIIPRQRVELNIPQRIVPSDFSYPKVVVTKGSWPLLRQ